MKGTNKRIRMADEYCCLSELSVSQLTGPRHDFVVETSLGGVIDMSNITCVHIKPYGKEESYWADVKTGTLYSESGMCMTSSVRRILFDFVEKVENRDWEVVKTYRIRSGDPNVPAPRAAMTESKDGRGRPRRVLDDETARMMLEKLPSGKWKWPNVYFAEILNVSPERAGKLRPVAANQLMKEVA